MKKKTLIGALALGACSEPVKEMDMGLVDTESQKRIKDLKEDDNQVLVIYTLK